MTNFELQAIVHLIGEEGDVARSTRVTNKEELEAAGPSAVEEGLGYQAMIEDLRMKPAVDKLITIMKEAGITFGSGKYLYGYIEGQVRKFGQESLLKGAVISEAELRVAAQSHLNSLLGTDKEEEFSYIEEQYTKVTGVPVDIGQTSLDDYIGEQYTETVDIGQTSIDDHLEEDAV
jgi:hypothetical protein